MAIDSDLALGGPAKRRWSQDITLRAGFADPQQPTADGMMEAVDGIFARNDRLPFGHPYPYSSHTTTSIAQTTTPTPRSRRSMPAIDVAIERTVSHTVRFLAGYVSPYRLASHFSVIAVAAVVLVFSQLGLPKWEVTLRLLPGSVPTDSADGHSAVSRVSAFAGSESVVPVAGNDSLQRLAIPFTIIEEESTGDIQYYTVQSGDTVLGIAEKFGIHPETIIWSNQGLDKHVELIRPGDQLAILPVNGAYHTVTAGDSLSSLADDYGVTVEDIIAYPANGLTDAGGPLAAGQKLVIPGGSKPFVEQYAVAYSGPIPANARIGSGAFVWPASGPITQSYWAAHPALDIGGWAGAPVKAADSGYVTLAAGGWNTGYGNYVIVDHGNGFSTLYSHLNSVFVAPGESVARGEQIGTVGSTGNSTGPHLHLEIRYQGVPRNPMGYLP